MNMVAPISTMCVVAATVMILIGNGIDNYGTQVKSEFIKKISVGVWITGIIVALVGIVLYFTKRI